MLSDSGRLYRLQLPGGDVQVVERWSGSERLSGGFEWWVDVLSTQAGLPLEAWLGRRATLYSRLADGDESPRTGLIHDAYALGSDGGLARYRVGLVPWTWWLSQGRHSRVFQERTLVQIVEAVFADYAPMASWQWSEETSAFLAQARPRSYCVQYRESDLDFVQRLLAEEGLGWRLQEAARRPAGTSWWCSPTASRNRRTPVRRRAAGCATTAATPPRRPTACWRSAPPGGWAAAG